MMANTLLSNQCTQRKNVELLKHIKIGKAATTCFGLQGNHHQGATSRTWLKLRTGSLRIHRGRIGAVSVMAA